MALPSGGASNVGTGAGSSFANSLGAGPANVGTAGSGITAPSEGGSAPAAGGDSTAAASQASPEAKATEAKNEGAKDKGCGGGGCGRGVTGDCCKYQNQVNSAMQKALAPYSDSCGSCGGSGVQGGGEGGGSGGGGDSGSGGISPTVYELAYIFNTNTVTPPPAKGHIVLDNTAFGKNTTISVDWVVDIPPYYLSGTVSSTSFSPSLMQEAGYQLPINIYLSNIDKNGLSAEPVLSKMRVDEPFTLVKISEPSSSATFNFISSIDDGINTKISATLLASRGSFLDGDILTINVNSLILNIPEGTTVLQPCPDCAGTGLEGSTAGIPGLIMAVYNGSAGFAGHTHYDIYGIVQSP